MNGSFQRAALLLINIIVGLCLGGCGLRGQAREADGLLVVQTMGLDPDRRGVLLSLASAGGAAPDSPPVRLQSAGASITTALEHIRVGANEEDLFCAHIGHLLIGEAAARKGRHVITTAIEHPGVSEAFAHLLPSEVAWRQKEQFSDGVGYSWIDTLKQLTAQAVSDEQMAHAAERFPINPPKNKEEYYYRSIFAEHFPSDSAARSVPSEASVACSTAIALEWDAAFRNMNDPSGRAIKGVHEQAY